MNKIAKSVILLKVLAPVHVLLARVVLQSVVMEYVILPVLVVVRYSLQNRGLTFVTLEPVTIDANLM